MSEARATRTAVLAATTTELAFDATYALARGSVIDPPYVVMTTALAFAACIAVMVVAALTPLSVRAALTAWTFVALFWIAPGGSSLRLLVAPSYAALAWLALGLRPDLRDRPLHAGISVGASLAIALVVWTGTVRVVSTPLEGAAALLTQLMVFPLALAGLGLWARVLTPRMGRSEAWIAVGILLVALLGVTETLRHARPQTRDATRISATPESEAPSLLVVVLDTVRADHLSLYGYARRTTPELDRFVARSDRARVYPRAYAPSNWTVPSHASLLTGLLPSEHGAHTGGAPKLDQLTVTTVDLRAEQTLAERLAARGYGTVGVLANPYLLRARGLERGFDRWAQPPRTKAFVLSAEGMRRTLIPRVRPDVAAPHESARAVNRQVVEVLTECGQAPCFVLANYMEAHGPYVPAPAFAGKFAAGGGPQHVQFGQTPEETAYAMARYDEEVLELDAALGELLATLTEQGFLDDTWLIVTSDHGEAFLEHGNARHGGSGFDEEVRVPLVIQPPRGITLPEPAGAVGLLDVAATLAAIAGAEPFGRGRDLRQPGLTGGVPIQYFRVANAVPAGADTGPGRAVVADGHKLIAGASGEALYDLDADPGERQDRSEIDAARAEALRALLPPPVSDESTPEPRSDG